MLVNGLHTNTISIDDRGLSYGDGVFETIRLHNGQAPFLKAHLNRLAGACERLAFNCDLALLRQDIERLSSEFLQHDILKIIISREAGGRGYRPAANTGVNRILSLHDLPNNNQDFNSTGIHTFLCQQRLALQPSLAGIKHLNRLEQVLASLEWPSDDFQEGLMQDTQGNVIEGTKTNLFIVEAKQLITPNLENCGVVGIMREVLIRALSAKQEQVSLERLLEADEVFVCNSVLGVWPVFSLQIAAQVHRFQLGEQSTQAQQVFNQALYQNAV